LRKFIKSFISEENLRQDFIEGAVEIDSEAVATSEHRYSSFPHRASLSFLSKPLAVRAHGPHHQRMAQPPPVEQLVALEAPSLVRAANAESRRSVSLVPQLGQAIG
jgi:hypothetical protein